jgi:hypothetical protein
MAVNPRISDLATIEASQDAKISMHVKILLDDNEPGATFTGHAHLLRSGTSYEEETTKDLRLC